MKANAKDITGWGVIPFDEHELKPFLNLFHQSWYLHVTSVVDDVEWGEEEDLFLSACREVALACYMIVFVQGKSCGGRSVRFAVGRHVFSSLSTYTENFMVFTIFLLVAQYERDI